MCKQIEQLGQYTAPCYTEVSIFLNKYYGMQGNNQQFISVPVTLYNY